MRSSRLLVVLAASAAVGTAACNEAFVPDYNAPTQFAHSVGALQNEFTGMFDAPRVDAATYTEAMEGFGRNAAYFTASEERFVTQYTGKSALDNNSFGAGVWANELSAVKVADSIISILPTLAVAGVPVIPVPNREALYGAAETFKALDYLYIAESHDTNGVAVNGVGLPLGSAPAPILCNKDVWQQIIAMLDSAVDSLTTAGQYTVLGIPNTTLPKLALPNTFSQLGDSAGHWRAFALALRGKARVQYAYAIARSSSATAPTVSSPGAPDQNQLDSAIIDILASAPLYSATLSPSEAVFTNDVGVFHDFSSASGDRLNALGSAAGSIFALRDAVAQIDSEHDQRFLAMFNYSTALPSSQGSAAASHWVIQGHISTTTPITIVRNLELQFLLAQAYLGTSQFALAISTINAVRTTVGGLSDTAAFVPLTYTSVRDFLMREQRPTLIMDGTGDRNIALREYGLVTEADTTWAPNDFQTSMENIPLNESNARGGNITPVCP
jgi:hypothetical protein